MITEMAIEAETSQVLLQTLMDMLTKSGVCLINYTQLQKKVYAFRFVEYSEGSGPEMNLGGAQYSL